MGVASFWEIENKLQKLKYNLLITQSYAVLFIIPGLGFYNKLLAGNNDHAISHFPITSPLPLQKYKASKV